MRALSLAWILLAVCCLTGCGEAKKVFTYQGKSAEDWAKQLGEEKSDTRSKALLALSNICEKDAGEVKHLAKGLLDQSPDLRLTTIKLLGNLGALAKGAVPELLTLIRNEMEEDYLRTEAGIALQKIDAVAYAHKDDPVEPAAGAAAPAEGGTPAAATPPAEGAAPAAETKAPAAAPAEGANQPTAPVEGKKE